MDIVDNSSTPVAVPFASLPNMCAFHDGSSIGLKIDASLSVNARTGEHGAPPAGYMVFRKDSVLTVTDYAAPA